jgi:hypothetical protein
MPLVEPSATRSCIIPGDVWLGGCGLGPVMWSKARKAACKRFWTQYDLHHVHDLELGLILLLHQPRHVAALYAGH